MKMGYRSFHDHVVNGGDGVNGITRSNEETEYHPGPNMTSAASLLRVEPLPPSAPFATPR